MVVPRDSLLVEMMAVSRAALWVDVSVLAKVEKTVVQLAELKAGWMAARRAVEWAVCLAELRAVTRAVMMVAERVEKKGTLQVGSKAVEMAG